MIRLACSQPAVVPPNFPLSPSIAVAFERTVWGDAKGEGNVGSGQRDWTTRSAITYKPDAGAQLVERLVAIRGGCNTILLDDEAPTNWRTDVAPSDTEVCRTWRRYSISAAVDATTKGGPLKGCEIAACCWPDHEDWEHEISPLYHRAHTLAVMCFPKYVRVTASSWRLESLDEYDARMSGKVQLAQWKPDAPCKVVHAIGCTTPKHPVTGERGRLPAEYIERAARVAKDNDHGIILFVTPDAASLKNEPQRVRDDYGAWFDSIAGVCKSTAE